MKNNFINFLYWFIHNEVLTPILIVCVFTFGFIIAPFYIVGNYFHEYYYRANIKFLNK